MLPMRAYSMGNMEPQYGITINRYNGKWGLYLELGRRVMVYELGKNAEAEEGKASA